MAHSYFGHGYVIIDRSDPDTVDASGGVHEGRTKLINCVIYNDKPQSPIGAICVDFVVDAKTHKLEYPQLNMWAIGRTTDDESWIPACNAQLKDSGISIGGATTNTGAFGIDEFLHQTLRAPTPPPGGPTIMPPMPDLHEVGIDIPFGPIDPKFRPHFVSHQNLGIIEAMGKMEDADVLGSNVIPAMREVFAEIRRRELLPPDTVIGDTNDHDPQPHQGPPAPSR